MSYENTQYRPPKSTVDWRTAIVSICYGLLPTSSSKLECHFSGLFFVSLVQVIKNPCKDDYPGSFFFLLCVFKSHQRWQVIE